MNVTVIGDGSSRSLILVFDRGEEVLETLTRYARREGLSACHFTGIGAFSEAVVGFFDWEKKEYARIPIREQVELLSLAGDIALKDGDPVIHAHAVLGKRDGSAHGGHLLSAKVRPTLELVLVESSALLVREPDAETGLALIRTGRGGAARHNGRSTRPSGRPPGRKPSAGSVRRHQAP